MGAVGSFHNSIMGGKRSLDVLESHEYQGVSLEDTPALGSTTAESVLKGGEAITDARLFYELSHSSKTTVWANRFGLAVMPARIQASEHDGWSASLSVPVHHSC
jgi:hypothetical protein